MKAISIVLGIVLIVVGCQNISQPTIKEASPSQTSSNLITSNSLSINKDTLTYNATVNSCLSFTKNGICGIDLGDDLNSSINNLKKRFKDFELISVSSNDWGYGGGTESFLVRKNGVNQFVLIPSSENNRILFIVILNSNYVNSEGLKTGISVKEILGIKSNLKFTINLMNGYEESSFNKNTTLIFLTEDENRIGEYKEIESYSSAIETNIKVDRIILSDNTPR